MFIARILAGGLLLILGRKLFWLFVAATGFAAGLAIATRIFDVRPEWLALVIALAVGVAGAILAIVIQRIAIVVAGFLIGAVIAVSLAGAVGIERGLWFWIALAAGGIIGVILMTATFDWALIGLSSLAGASLVVEGLRVAPALAWPALLILFVVGILIQAGIMRAEKQPASQRDRRAG